MLVGKKRKVSPLKVLLLERSILQADLAAAAEVSEARLSRILNGRMQSRDWERKAIAKALNIPIKELNI